jgi:uncharacterized membrane protein HdeD (DUF308 family)
VYLFAAYALVDGISAILAIVRGEPEARRNGWALGIIGIAGIVAAIGSVIWPDITALALLYLVAAWAIVSGVFQIAAAIRLRKEIEGELLLALSGVASIVFGVLLIVFPGAGLLSLVWLIAAWSVVFGVMLLGLAWRLRSWQSERGGRTGRAASAA